MAKIINAWELRKVALKMWEQGQYTLVDYARFCEKNKILMF